MLSSTKRSRDAACLSGNSPVARSSMSRVGSRAGASESSSEGSPIERSTRCSKKCFTPPRRMPRSDDGASKCCVKRPAPYRSINSCTAANALGSRTRSSTESRNCLAWVIHVSRSFGTSSESPSNIRCVTRSFSGTWPPSVVQALSTIRSTSDVVAAVKTRSNSLTLAAPRGLLFSSDFARCTIVDVSATSPNRGRQAASRSRSRSRLRARTMESGLPPRDSGT